MFYGKLMFWGFSQDICFGHERYIMRLFYSLITERAMLGSDSVIKPVTQNNSLGLVIGSNAGSLDTDQIFSYITLTSALPSTKQITWTDSSYSQRISQVCLQEKSQSRVTHKCKTYRTIWHLHYRHKWCYEDTGVKLLHLWQWVKFSQGHRQRGI